MSKITLLEQLRQLAEAAKTYTDGLMAKLAQTTVEAVEEVEAAKANKPKGISASLATGNWTLDETAGYPYYCDITAAGATAKDRAEVAVVPGSLATASECGLCPTCETLSGKIRIRAVKAPTAAIAVTYWLDGGKE